MDRFWMMTTWLQETFNIKKKAVRMIFRSAFKRAQEH